MISHRSKRVPLSLKKRKLKKKGCPYIVVAWKESRAAEGICS
jgi:hypothetical protein